MKKKKKNNKQIVFFRSYNIIVIIYYRGANDRHRIRRSETYARDSRRSTDGGRSTDLTRSSTASVGRSNRTYRFPFARAAPFAPRNRIRPLPVFAFNCARDVRAVYKINDDNTVAAAAARAVHTVPERRVSPHTRRAHVVSLLPSRRRHGPEAFSSSGPVGRTLRDPSPASGRVGFRRVVPRSRHTGRSARVPSRRRVRWRTKTYRRV